jgi:hypothetical protein
VAIPPRAKEGLLHCVFGVLERAEHPVAVQLELGPVALNERRERGLVAGSRRGDDTAGFHLKR